MSGMDSGSGQSDIIKVGSRHLVQTGTQRLPAAIARSPVPPYMWRLLVDLQISCPPVSEFAIADHLGVAIKTFPATCSRFRALSFDAVFSEEDRTIFVRRELPYTRKRFSIFHEYAHQIIPWHQGMSVDCVDNAVTSGLYGEWENEADLGACELAMPAPWFVDDMGYWSDATWSSISAMASHYRMSLESVANRYVSFHSDPCAFMVCDPLWLEPEPNANVVFMVKYVVASTEFPFYIPKETIIEDSEAVFESVISREPVSMNAGEFGVDATGYLDVEVRLMRQPRPRLYVLATV